MEQILKCLKALSEESRVRIVMLLGKQELSVCELMGVLRISQPLVSRHLSILKEAGLVKSRRDGKLHFFSVTDEAPSGGKVGLIRLVSEVLEGDETLAMDTVRMEECLKMEKQTGKRDMETLLEFAKTEIVK